MRVYHVAKGFDFFCEEEIEMVYRWLNTAAVVCLFVVAGCVSGAKIPGVHEPLDSEKWSLCAGDMGEQDAVVIDLSLDAKTMLCRGVFFASSGRIEEGLELLAESAVRDKEDHRAYYLSGRILTGERRYEEALTAFERAAARFSAMKVPTERLARSLYRDKGSDEARIFLSKAVERGLCSYGCKRLYATLLSEAGDRKQAEVNYLAMIKNQPDEPAAYVGLARLYNKDGNHQKESEMLARARTSARFVDLTKAERANVNYALAFANYKLGQYAEAAVAIKDSLADREDAPDAHLLLGWIELKREQPEKALVSFEKAFGLNQRLGPAYAGAGDANATLEKFAEARTAYEKARDLQPTDVVVVLKLAYATARAGDKREAKRLLEMAEAFGSDNLPPNLKQKVAEVLE